MKIRTYGLKWRYHRADRTSVLIETSVKWNKIFDQIFDSVNSHSTRKFENTAPPPFQPHPFFCIDTISTLFIYWIARDILSVKYRSIKCVWESWSFVSKFCLSETFMFNYGSVTNRASSIVFSFALPCDIISTCTLIWTIIIVITSRTLRKNCH